MSDNSKGSFKEKLPFILIIATFIILSALLITFEFYPKNKITTTNPKNKISTTGIIYDFDFKNKRLLLNHNRIKGLIENYDNMSTYFNIISPHELNNLNVGDSISFDIHIKNRNNYHIENLNKINKSSLEVHDAIGVVLDIIKDKHQLVISHEEIPGFMSKMTMHLDAHKEIDIKHLNIGDSISFNFVLNQNNNYFISNLNYLGKSEIIKSNNDEDSYWDDEYDQKDIGQILDDANFLTLDSKEVSLNSINSDYKVISFIFSRCPIPTMCPAIITNNQFLANYFSNENITFIIISFDYIYDKPKVMNERYGLIQNKNTNLLFLSSYNHLIDLYRLTSQMGYFYSGIEENNISHLNKIAIIDKNNKILKYYDNFEVTAKQIKNDLNQLLEYID